MSPAAESPSSQAIHGDDAPVLVLRCATPHVLGEAVRDLCWARQGRELRLLLPCGPYAFPYAAAHELARQLAQGARNPPDHADAAVLGRDALAAMLGRLLREPAVLAVPRLDLLDAESAALFSDLLRTSRVLAGAGGTPPVRLVGGVPAGEPSKALRTLLDQWASLPLELDPVAPQPLPELPAAARLLVTLLQQAPHPLEPAVLADMAGLPRAELDQWLVRLQAEGLVSVAGRVGLGCGADRYEAGEVDKGNARRLLAEKGGITLPAARLALLQCTDAHLAWELARLEHARSEPAVALAHYRLARLAGGGIAAEADVRYAVALAESGFLEAAAAHYEELKGRNLDAAGFYELGLLAFHLCRAGLLPFDMADGALRRGERACRDNLADRALDLRARRAHLMCRRGESSRALTLLRRASREELLAAPPAPRREYLTAMACACWDTGAWKLAARHLDEARALCTGPRELLQVEDAACSYARADTAQRRLATRGVLLAAVALLEPSYLERHAPDGLVSSSEMQTALLGSARALYGDAATPPAGDLPAAWRWLHARGATLLAVLDKGFLRFEPAGVAAAPGLRDWLHAELARLRDHPWAAAVGLQPVPGAGLYDGEFVLLLQRFCGFSPALALLRRDRMSNLDALLAELRLLCEAGE
ncbi:MAG: hypothetical protein IT463_07040 [Planctomycetes bacterium]|nr:hypothetical protein [Planctomycetota bacterium]